MSNQFNHADLSQMRSSLGKIQKILQTEIFNPVAGQSPFFEPCITQILIELNDVLQKLANSPLRINFTDDMPNKLKSKDITDLINECRNSACHISSGGRRLQSFKISMAVIVGFCPVGMVFNGEVLGCQYPDDVAIIWGNTRVYLIRHIVRAVDEAIGALAE